jgi:hypothetical protein
MHPDFDGLASKWERVTVTRICSVKPDHMAKRPQGLRLAEV